MNPTTQLTEAIEEALCSFGTATARVVSEGPPVPKDAAGRLSGPTTNTILLAIADAVDAQNGEDAGTHAVHCADEDECTCGITRLVEERARWRQWAGELRERANNEEISKL